MYMCVCIHVYVCMHNIWGGIVRGEMSYPKREGELSGELFIGEVFGEVFGGNCPGGIVLHPKNSCELPWCSNQVAGRTRVFTHPPV